MGTPLSASPSASELPLARRRIDGWLLVFVVTVTLRCVFATYYLTLASSPFAPQGRNLQAAVPSYLVYVLFQLASTTANSIMPLLGLVMLYRRSRRAGTLFTMYLTFVIIDGLVELSALRLLYPSLAEAFRGAGDSLAPLDTARDRQFLIGVREVAYGSIWLLYWFKSTKVRHLFTAQDAEHQV